MIYLDIFVACVGSTYEFACDPDVPIAELNDRIREAVGRMEGIDFETAGAPVPLRLCSKDLQTILSGKCSLSDYGIQNGGRMILL